MTAPASNLLIAAAIDFARHGWADGTAERMAASLELGRGGKVRSDSAPGAILLVRHRDGTTGQAGPGKSHHGVQILFAGHLHDRSDLRLRLGLPPGQPFDDGEIYAAAYARWGDDCDRQVNGHYAAVLWHPDQGLVRAARSPVDPSPLHWWSDGTRLVIASTPRAIFAAGAPRRLDDAKLDAALVGSFADPTRSWFSGINRLEGGTVMTWRRGAQTSRRFWSIEALSEVRFKRDENYVEALDDLFTRATAEALIGVRKPGLLLSGGLDSQAVASYALDAIGPKEPLECYTSVPTQGFIPIERVDTFPDERAHVEALAAMYPRLNVHTVEAADRDFTHHLSEMFLLGSAMPLAALNLHWIHQSLAQASAQGCDVMLSGSSGNASFSYDGDTAFALWLRQGNMMRLARELRSVDRARPLYRRLITWAVMPNLPRPIRVRLSKLVSPGPDDLAGPLREEYLRRHGLHDLADAIPQRPARTSRLARGQLLSMGSAEAGDTELALELLHGLPFRDPTAYRPLFEFCAGIPEDQYRRDGVSRWLARRVLKGRIPEAVRLENRIGQQGADWPLRLERARPAMLAELNAMVTDDSMAERFDLPRITAALEQWDGRDTRASRVFETVALASSRTIAASRFIRFANGSNG
ncbi:asparagine synthase-related protein [Novosphingobium sp.]|uniref:asparagine synthase-related protein n=1 Tax=Novosphingobium sp. TaxID=1874826 RepID=UPI00286D91C1|nr:asparagine synthase-related protein [Novosphingobium sp.]